MMKPSLILINPWIYDFAAYDLWSKPLGLLYLAGTLRRSGFKIHLIDCLDVHHPDMGGVRSMINPIRRAYGTGKFWREPVPKPIQLRHVKRPYARYGITKSLFMKELNKTKDPAAILVTSLMTYWYPGVREAIALAREVHPRAPIILGGIYVRLCKEHALRYSGADCVVSDGDLRDPASILRAMHPLELPAGEGAGVGPEPPYPAFDLLPRIDYICMLTSRGCPYRCRYCASRFLNPTPFRREPDDILEEIAYWHRGHGIRDFAFYDDALLVESGAHMGRVLEDLARRGLRLRFHTPNALHVREISPDIARLLFLSGFRTIRLGLETSDIKEHDELDGKVSEGEFERAVRNLKAAGYSGKEIGAYILTGLPGQSVESVARTIRYVGGLGASPYLAEYSPLPHTPLWEKALSHSEYDLASEPLFHNNSLLPCWNESQREKFPELKRLVQEIRQSDS